MLANQRSTCKINQRKYLKIPTLKHRAARNENQFSSDLNFSVMPLEVSSLLAVVVMQSKLLILQMTSQANEVLLVCLYFRVFMAEKPMFRLFAMRLLSR